MSKGEGRFIAIKFDKALSGDVKNIVRYEDSKIPLKAYSSDLVYSATYPIGNAFNGVAGDYWAVGLCAAPHWLLIEPVDLVKLTMFKIVVNNTTYSVKNFKIQGSQDGVNFDDLYTDYVPASYEWFTFIINSPIAYKYYRFYMIDAWTTTAAAVRVYEVEFWYSKPVGNELAFSATGEQYLHVNGPLIPMVYPIYDIALHPTELNTILLSVGPWQRFNNVEGQVRIQYDKTKGSLEGAIGTIESFDELFTPTELVKKPNPHHVENLHATMQCSVVNTKVNWEYGYEPENIESKLVVIIAVTKVGSNPL